MAGEIKRSNRSFDANGFVYDVVERFPELELKARISWIADCLKSHLPADYEKAVSILIRSLPTPNDPHLSDDDFGDFIYAPYAEYVARNGCEKDNLKISFYALHEITQRFSVEYAIRDFINTFPKETLKELSLWAKDPHYHVRRLCSEGTRPKLPWAKKIDIPVHLPISILDKLFSDRTRFVTRSVANHINDVSKIDPDLAISILERWKYSGKQKKQEMDYIIRHSLRTLIKEGEPRALALLGVSHNARFELSRFDVPEKVKMNTALEFSLVIKAKEDANFIIDYILYFQNRSGRLGGPKVFKLKRCFMVKGQDLVLVKCHMLHENMTTRKLFRGRHEIAIQINGKIRGKKVFYMT